MGYHSGKDFSNFFLCVYFYFPAYYRKFSKYFLSQIALFSYKCLYYHIAGLVENYGISNTIVLEIP